eukprot:5484790-Lingulodinium_polyedra.AAC.1
MIRGDGDWLANALGLESASGRFPCVWCAANTFDTGLEPFAATYNVAPAPWNDIGPDAAWRNL